MKKIAIVGGGLSGLAAAYELELKQAKNPAEIHLFERNDRLGGVLQTDATDGYLVEQSADMFVVEPGDALGLIRELGHEPDLIATRKVNQRACIAFGGKLHDVPTGFSLMQPSLLHPILKSTLLSWEGKARLLREMHLNNSAEPADGTDESLADFATRRFGREVFERLIQPLAAGIYTADPEKLSMAATMKRFVDAVQIHGSLIRAGMQAKKESGDQKASGARYSLFRAPRDGMGSLISWLTDSLRHTRIRLNCGVVGMKQVDSGWRLKTSRGEESFDGIVIATPPKASADLLLPIETRVSEELLRIKSASSAIVVLGLDQSQFSKHFAGFGVVFPGCEKGKLIACSFSSNKFEGRAPEGKVLIRGFLGGALSPDLVEESNETLIGYVTKELEKLFGFHGQPEFSQVFRWRKCMPQYHVNHLKTVDSIEHRVSRISGLELAGNGYRGVGIPVCIRSGREAATRLLDSFKED